MITVVRVQVQRARLKPLPAKDYDPSPLLEVEALAVGPRGVVGLPGEVLDVHHADHPDSRNRDLGNGISLLDVAAYDRMRQRFGAHLVDGIAGESVLLDGPPPTGDLLLGDLVLTEVAPMPPCIGFSRFCVGGTDADEVAAAMSWLSGGARGWSARVTGSGTVAPGTPLLPR